MTTKIRACKWCAEPVASAPRRGRPSELHDVPCRRLWRNRRTLNNRISAFRAAHRYDVDRTDRNPFAPADSGAVLEEGYRYEAGAFDHVHGNVLLAAMHSWEKSRANYHHFRRLEREALAEMTEAGREMYRAAMLIPADEYEALLRRDRRRRPSPAYLKAQEARRRASSE
jgi:hypothetical protein